jgi:hypothetical protein
VDCFRAIEDDDAKAVEDDEGSEGSEEAERLLRCGINRLGSDVEDDAT